MGEIPKCKCSFNFKLVRPRRTTTLSANTGQEIETMMFKKMALVALITSFAAACATPQRIELANVPASTGGCKLNGNTFKKNKAVRAYELAVIRAQARCHTLEISDVEKLDGHYRKIQKYLDANGCTWKQVPLTHVEKLSDFCPEDDWKFAGKSFEFGKSKISELEDPLASRDATSRDEEPDRTTATDHARESADTRQAVEAVESPQIEPRFVQAANGKMPPESDLAKAVIAMVGACPGKKVVCQGIASAGVELPRGKVSNKDLSDKRLNMCLTAVRNAGGDAIPTSNPDYAGNEAVRGVYLTCYSGSKDELFDRIPDIMAQADDAKRQAEEMRRKMAELDRQLDEARAAADAARKAAKEADQRITEVEERPDLVIPALRGIQFDLGAFGLGSPAGVAAGGKVGLVFPIGDIWRGQLGFIGSYSPTGGWGWGPELEFRYPLMRLADAVFMFTPRVMYYRDEGPDLKLQRYDGVVGAGFRGEFDNLYMAFAAHLTVRGIAENKIGFDDPVPLLVTFSLGFIYPGSAEAEK